MAEIVFTISSLCDYFNRKEKVVKKTAVFKLLLTWVGGPAAGAFGLWLATEAPAIHAAMCSAGG